MILIQPYNDKSIMSDDYISTLTKGAISGAISRTIASPFEVVKIYQQTKKYPQRDLIGCMRFIYAQKGWRGFFKGNGANMYRVVPNYALNFLIFDQLKDKTTKIIPKKDIANLVTGSISGILSITAVYPLETIRTYMTMDKVKYPTVTSTVKDIVARNGVTGLYKGLSMSMINIGPYIGINFAVFHWLDDLYKTKNPAIHFFYGCVAGTTSVIFTFPTDLLRTRMHIQQSSLWKGERYDNIVHATRTIYISEGIKGFYKGGSAACCRVSISMGAMFAINKLLNSLF